MKKFILLFITLFCCALFPCGAFAYIVENPDCVRIGLYETLAGLGLWAAVVATPFAVKFALLKNEFLRLFESPERAKMVYIRTNGLLYGLFIAVFSIMGIFAVLNTHYLPIDVTKHVDIILYILPGLLLLTALEKIIYDSRADKEVSGSWRMIFFANFAGCFLAAVFFYLAFILPAPVGEWPMTTEGCYSNIPKYSHVAVVCLLWLSHWAFRHYTRMKAQQPASLKKWLGLVLVGIGICVMTLSALTGNFNLRTALYHDRLFGFRLMLAAGFDPNEDPELLKLAVHFRRPDKSGFIKALLDSNLDWSKQNALTTAAGTGNAEVVRLSLEKGKTPADVSEALIAAADNKGTEVAKLLISFPFSVPAGQQALAKAAETGNLELVKLLVEKGVDVNTPSPWQPLEKAIRRSRYPGGDDKIDTVRYLLDKGAEPEIRTCLSSEAHCSEKDIQDEKSAGGFKIPGYEHIYNENMRDTMLCLAIKQRAYGVTKLLLERGADPHRTKQDGRDARSPSVCIENAYLSPEMSEKFEELFQLYGITPLTVEQKRALNVTQAGLDRHKARLKRAEAGFASGQAALGEAYIRGDREADVPADPKLGFSWIKKAVENGEQSAQCDLAKLYSSGTGTEQSNIDAYFWYRVCSEASSINKIVYEKDIERIRHGLTDVQIEEAERRIRDWQEKVEANKAE